MKAIEALAELADPDWCRLLNVGGGLGIAYLAADEPPSIEAYADVKVEGVERVFDPVPRILVEPGRSLVGNAGITLYTVGTVKEIPGVRTYVAVDGGMSDNLRPMLYGARYEALIADRAAEPPETLVTIAGMHCESSDILVRDAMLAAPRVGDVLVTPATGAYGHAMANNYNGVPRPPVIFCSGGDAPRCVRDGRETWDDLRRAAAELERKGDRPHRRCLGRWRRPVGPRPRHRRRRVRRARRPSAAEVEAAAGAARRSPASCAAPRATSSRSSRRSEIVVELIGGTDPARDYVLRALRAGRHVVTANKQLSPSTATSCSRPPARPASSFASRRRSPASCR